MAGGIRGVCSGHLDSFELTVEVLSGHGWNIHDGKRKGTRVRPARVAEERWAEVVPQKPGGECVSRENDHLCQTFWRIEAR